MTLQQAKQKLDTISKSIGTKHSKILISDLCGIIRLLIVELEKTGSLIESNIKLPKYKELQLKTDGIDDNA